MPDSEQVEDRQVLLALRHPPLVGRHDEHRRLHRPHPGQHVLEEPHVTGDVNEGQLLTGRERGEGEPEIDREAPGLLGGPAVRVGPGQGQDERRLPVIHVPGRRDNAHLSRVPRRAGSDQQDVPSPIRSKHTALPGEPPPDPPQPQPARVATENGSVIHSKARR